MRAVLRFLATTLLCAALTALIAPQRMQAAETHEPSCCAHRQMDQAAQGCSHHAPTKERDQSCCQACALGLTLLFIAPSSFVYAQTGEETFLTLSARSDALPHRPPVPPPRTSLS
jgi:hypothetical protein